MALIDNQKFPLSRWWLIKGIEIIEKNRNIFSSAEMRRARVEFIAGSAVLKAIRNWLLAAQIIQNKGKEYFITDFGKTIITHDPTLEKASTWWAFHLSICFSNKNEPYASFFLSLDSCANDWIAWEQLIKQVRASVVRNEQSENYAEETIKSTLEGVKGMFLADRPLAELGMIEIRSVIGEGIFVRLGMPTVMNEVIVHALALMRFHCFPSRVSIDFSELIKEGLDRFLCLSPNALRNKLRTISRMERWQNAFSFTETANLNSIDFSDSFMPRKTLLVLLQEGQNTWL